MPTMLTTENTIEASVLAKLRDARDEGWLGVQPDSDSDGWLRWNAYGPDQEYVDFGRNGLNELGVPDQAYCPVYPTAVAAWIRHVEDAFPEGYYESLESDEEDRYPQKTRIAEVLAAESRFAR